MAPAVKTGYWNIRGYAQPIRLLLAYAGVEHEDRRYKDEEEALWKQEKPNLGLDFPNLPYYMDGDVKLSQTFAILKYLGRKHNMKANNEREQIRLDLIEAEAEDMRFKWSTLVYSPEFEQKKTDFVKGLPDKLKELSAFLGTHDYFVGNHITYIDFLMYEMFDVHSKLVPGLLNDFPNLKAYHARIQGNDKISAYIKSNKFIHDLNGSEAYFNPKL